jgi:hypothetical protein
MSVATPEKLAPTIGQPPPDMKIRIHSPQMYWWPVWVAGFAVALWTYLDNEHLVLAPEGSVVQGNTLTAPEGTTLEATGLHVARTKVPGLFFTFVLLTVVTFNTGWFRGWKPYVVALVLVCLALFFQWLRWWPSLYEWAGYLDVRLNLCGYLVISTVLALLWAWYFFGVDHRMYFVLSASQIRIRHRVLDEERVFDSGWVAFSKRPTDWFRYVIGFGAGDLVLKIGGPNPQTIELPNVTFANARLARIEKLLRTKDVE